MQTSAEFIGSVLICALGLSIAGGYFLVRLCSAAGRTAWWTALDSPQGRQARRRRRSLGMTIVAVVSLATFSGINFLDPMRFPVQYGCYWLVVTAMLMWLFALALADLRHTMKLLHAWQRDRTYASLQRFLESCRESQPAVQRRREDRES